MLGIAFIQIFFCLLKVISSDGYFEINENSNERYSYQTLPFSNLFPPLHSISFTRIREGDYCDKSHIIKQQTSSGAILDHGPCDIYTEVQNLLEVGYQYAIITNYDLTNWINDQPSLPIFVFTLTQTIQNHNNFLKQTQMNEFQITFFPTNHSHHLYICEQKIQYLLQKKMLSNLYSITYSCISNAINQFKEQRANMCISSLLQLIHMFLYSNQLIIYLVFLYHLSGDFVCTVL